MTRRTLFRAIGVAVSLACLSYFMVEAQKVWSSSKGAIDLAGMSRKMPLAAMFWIAAYLAFGGTWHYLLRLSGLRPSMSKSFGIYLTAQLAKYLPGNVAHHAGKIYLSVKHGLPASTVGVCMVVELVLAVLCAGVLAIPLLDLLLDRPSPPAHPIVLIALVLALFALVASAAVLVWRMPRLHAMREQLKGMLLVAKASGSMRFAAASVSCTLIGMILASISLLALCGLEQFDDYDKIVKGVALFCIAWIAGFLTPGAPAGLGTREAILVEGFRPIVGAELAIGATILLRLLSVSVDFFAFLLGVVLLRRSAHRT